LRSLRSTKTKLFSDPLQAMIQMIIIDEDYNLNLAPDTP
jgi:hypothetical protein